MTGKLGINSRWDIVPAALSVLLYINFIVFIVLLFAATGVLFLYSAPSLLTAGLLIAAIITHLVTNRKSSKLWRRLLLGGIAANLMIILFFVLTVVVMMAAWGNVSPAK